ncbi:SusC/RagA family TonB-linked outer membrane protein [Draconibacterium sp. IB214405]|uniref:SusC/RagA family TonB-linked outer membrane protein n=1 Tax=Draconibacterium sp. IB214405 TaxID=3097352 RepID=UPI002A11D05E|nr:SusC/RagA family TonB-linked outer membrane protein [Draconibacterium sp. IB214405]MDX8339550.1 SusC/RagA family TonB-linked outer membrane protein [Draconibacterium sp. IB214405]
MKRFLFTILLMSAVTLFATAQKRTINGVVREQSTNDLLPGVTVLEKGTSNGTVTNVDGEFSLSVEQGATLVVSYIGLESKEVVVGSSSTIEVMLVPSSEQVDEVVVTAMGIRKETKALGYAVQAIEGTEIVKVKEPNLVNSLNGKIAGVNVTNSGGGAGTSSQIIIRGSTSLTGDNQPLFIVDGIPIDNSTVGADYGAGLSATSTYSGNRGMDINSDDIESISVLKGPAAAALYGLKAAAGAIVITTKKGESGATKVNVSSKFKVDVANKLPENQELYGQGSDGAFDDGTAFSWGAPIGNATTYDNMGEFLEPAFSYDVTGSVSGGNDNGNYFISVHRLDQNGIVPTTEYATNSFRINGEQRKGWFTFGMNSNYIYSQTTKTLTGSGLYGSSGSGAMLGLLRWPITNDMSNWIEAGQRVPLLPDVDPADDVDNPYWTVYKNPVTDDLHRFIGSGYVTMQPTEWLTATYRAGIDHYNTFSRNLVFPGSAVTESYLDGAVTESQRENNILTSNLTVSANKEVDDFNLGLMLGHNYEQSTYFSQRQRAIGLLTEFISVNNADRDSKSFSNYQSKKRLYSAFGEFTASYKNIAFLSVTGRNDWSSTLSEENRSFFYPSVSGSFVFSELFGEDLKETFSFGKLRASWSQVGKDAPVYQTATYLETVSVIGGGYKNAYTGGNPYLKPETTESTELGLDVRFFNGKLGADFTYYDTRSKDQIISPRVSMATGYIFQYVNFGTVINKGFELTLTGKPIQTRDWKWNTTLNISHNDGTVTDLPEGVELLYVTDVQIGPAKSASVGEGIFLGLTGQLWERTEDGDIILDSDTGRPITSTDATNVVGNREPDMLLGWNNSITHKNWNLSFLIDVRVGGDVYNATEYSMTYAGMSKVTENRGNTQTIEGVMMNSETGEYEPATSTITLDQDYYQNIYTAEATPFITSVNWFRLRSASLSYSVPATLCNRIGFVKGIDLSLSGTNLLLFTNYKGMDPEVSAGGSGILGAGSSGIDYCGVPATTSVSFGLNVQF